MRTPEQLFQHFKERQETIRAAISDYEKDPVGVRNLIAELGVETTPHELQTYISLFKSILELIDNGQE